MTGGPHVLAIPVALAGAHTRSLVRFDNKLDRDRIIVGHLRTSRHFELPACRASVLERATQEHFDLIVLDVMLPGMDGLQVCQNLRAQGIYTPILMLTAKKTEADRVFRIIGIPTKGENPRLQTRTATVYLFAPQNQNHQRLWKLPSK